MILLKKNNGHFQEHDRLERSDYEEIWGLVLEKWRKAPVDAMSLFSKIQYDARAESLKLSYFIGAEWIDDENALIVLPKIKNIDFQTMLMRCFEHSVASKGLDDIFLIRTEEKPIKINSEDFKLEPLLIIYFINLVSKIVNDGLCKDYVQLEERFRGKVKGKIQFSAYLKHGIATGRTDLVDCRYQEYSVDCLANRILKRALILCREMLQRSSKSMGKHYSALTQKIETSMYALAEVSENVTMQEVQHLHVNPMFRNYKSALRLAQMIIRKQGYCIQQDSETGEQLFPPFIIDMPLLFERYVYSLLVDRYGKQIDFQVSTYGNKMDFGKKDEHLIIDTKYIYTWKGDTNHENVRQLSGYARSKKLRDKLGVLSDETICPCLIIYPEKDGIKDFFMIGDNLFLSPQLEDIGEYVKFKKLAIQLPVLK